MKFRIKQFRELSSLAGRLLDESSHLSQIANSEGFDSGLASRILSVFIEEHLWGQLLIGFGDWLFSYELESEVQEAGNESFIDETLESWLATEAKKTTSAIRLWHKKNTCKDGGGCAESELNPIYRLAFLVEYFDECFGINIDFNRKSYKEDNLKPQDILTIMFSFKNIGSYKSTNLAVSENDKQDIEWESYNISNDVFENN